MPNCVVCSHPAREAIDRGLILKARISDLAKKYGISRPTLYNHRNNHLPLDMKEAAAEQLERVPTLIAELSDMKAIVSKLIQSMREKEDFRGAAGAVREATRLVELLAKVQGDLQPPPAVQINFSQTTEYHQVTGCIIAALADYPDAKRAVVLALEQAK